MAHAQAAQLLPPAADADHRYAQLPAGPNVPRPIGKINNGGKLETGALRRQGNDVLRPRGIAGGGMGIPVEADAAAFQLERRTVRKAAGRDRHRADLLAPEPLDELDRARDRREISREIRLLLPQQPEEFEPDALL